MDPVGHLIRPHIERAFRERPDLVAANTTQSCGLLLQLALKYGGADWSHVGKSRPSEAGFIPDGFVPTSVVVTRPDGQPETITVIKVSMDAAWYQGRQQVKVIANSTANESHDPSIWGPAKIGAYDIDPADYRYTNPPIPQVGSGPIDPPVDPPPPVTTIPPFPPRNETMDFGLIHNAHYQGKILAANPDAPPNGTLGGSQGATDRYTDYEGEVIWTSEYLRRRQLGESDADATAHVLADVDAAWPT